MAEKRQRCRPQTKLALPVCIAENRGRFMLQTKLILGVCMAEKSQRHRPQTKITLGVCIAEKTIDQTHLWESAWQKRDRDADHRPNSPLESA